MNESLVITNSGALTSIGVSSAQTCAAIRASISIFEEWDLSHLSYELEPAVAAFAPLQAQPRDNQYFNRLVEMATHAIRECLQGSVMVPDRTALLLGVRESFRTHPNLDGRDEELLHAIEQKLQIQFAAESCVIPKGNPSAFMGLIHARRLLDEGKVDNCIVGGVDSLVNWYDFKRFSGSFRLKSEEVAQGFISGEGAAFIAVTDRKFASSKAAFLGEILGVGWANEETEVTVLSDGYPTGKGLQRALEATVQDANVPESSIDFRISDMNGEYYRAIETMLGTTRFYKTRREYFDAWLPAACVGEIGAAVGALLIIMAMTGMIKGYAPGSMAMCEATADSGLGAGCLISALA